MTAPVATFRDLRLAPPLLRALADVGYETPSPIQQACIPVLLEGHDLLGEAQTGTGKTAAFALPLLERLDLSRAKPQVLILTPTRELAIQVAEAFQRYAKYLPGFHVLPIYGGQSMVLQLRQLHRGVHVIVGTPGRVIDHLKRKSLVLDALTGLVLDEADEMLRMGFIDDVKWILEHTPAARQTALFSATMPDTIRRVASAHMRTPREVKIRSHTKTVAAIHQRYWQVSGTNKLDALTRILEAEEQLDAALIFVRTKTATADLADRLEARGYAAAALNGDMTQVLRERVIEQLKNGKLDIVVATDVAARGIDVARISHVINYDIPYDPEAYVHRIGRTGRAGRTGNAILFVAPREFRMLRTIERITRQPIEALTLPSHDAVAGRRVAQFKKEVAAVMHSESLESFTDVVAQLGSEHEGDLVRIAAALVYMAQKAKPFRLPQRASIARPDATATEAPAAQAQRAPRPSRDGAERASRHAEAKSRHEARPQRETVSYSETLKPYRLAVGLAHQATPREIVGAIANEANLDSRYIGRIRLHENHSTVELPDNLPGDVLGILRKTRVRQQRLEIRPLGESELVAYAARKPGGERRAPNDPKDRRKLSVLPDRTTPGTAGRDGWSPRAPGNTSAGKRKFGANAARPNRISGHKSRAKPGKA